MKKYVIKNKDGSEQTEMPEFYDTRKKAWLAILDYVEDDSHIEDYIVEEVDVKDVNECITDFEKARQVLELKPNISFSVIKDLRRDSAVLHEKISRFAKEINPRYLDALIALNKLFTIAEAWNKLDGFVPDFSNWSQNKWTPLFGHTTSTKRLELSTTCMFSEVNESFGPRLCFKTRERAWQFGIQFLDLYNQVFLS